MSARWTDDDLARYRNRKGTPILGVTKEGKPSKYRNVRTEYEGELYDSKLESRCAQWLIARHQTGEVAWFTRQVPFVLEGGVRYRADFLAALTVGGIEVIDATGKMTQTKANKLKQVKARYGIDVILWPALTA